VGESGEEYSCILIHTKPYPTLDTSTRDLGGRPGNEVVDVDDDDGGGASADKADVRGNASLTYQDVSDLLEEKLRYLNTWCELVQSDHVDRVEERIEEAVYHAQDLAREKYAKEKDNTTKGLKWEIDKLKKDLKAATRAKNEAEEKMVAAEERLEKIEDDWRKREKEKQEAYEKEARRLRAVNALALDRARSAENSVGAKRSRELSGSREGDARREGGKGGVLTPARRKPVNVFKEPYVTRHEMEAREERERGDPAHKGKDSGAETPGTTGPFSREVSQAREADKGGEGNEERSGATESPLLAKRSSEARGGASERTEEEVESVATAPTGVVDLMDTSLDEGGGRGTGQESGLSEGEENDQEEVANQDPAEAALLSEEEKAALKKENKRVSDRAYRARRKAEKAALEGGEGGTAEASVGASAGEKPAAGTLRIEKRKAALTGMEEAIVQTTDETEKGGA
jgi:hypothetical protein